MAAAAADGRLWCNFQGYSMDPAPVLRSLGVSAIGTLPLAMPGTSRMSASGWRRWTRSG
jgi:hypothetical protein